MQAPSDKVYSDTYFLCALIKYVRMRTIQLLNGKDGMKTLQQKNDEHAKLLAKERHSAFYLALSLFPIFVIFGYDFYQGFVGAEALGFHPALVVFGTLLLALPFLAIGQMLILPSWLKMTLYVCIQILFTSLWFLDGLLWLAIIPLIVILGILQYQLPEIRKSAEQNENAT